MFPRTRPTRPTATAGASTSTATSRSARSSTASRARRSRTARAATSPARSSSPSPRCATRSGSRRRSANIKFVEQHPLVRRLLHVAARRLHPAARDAAVPAVRHAELLRPDRASTCSTGIKSHRGTAILPQQTGPVIDVLYSAAGNSRGRGVLQQRHHRLRLRDRGHALQRHRHRPGDLRPGPAAAVRRQPDQQLPRQRGLHEGDGVRRRQLRPAAVRARLPERHGGAGRRHRRGRRRQRRSTRCGSRATRRPRSTTRPTARRPPRPRPSGSRRAPARCRCRSSWHPGTNLKWIATDFKGNVSAVKSQVLGRTDTPGTVGGSVPATLSLTHRRARAVRRVHARHRRGRTSRRPRPP